MEAIQRSAATGRHVSLEPFEPGERPDPGDELKKSPIRRPDIHAPPPRH
jgi:hypothetical protein